MRVDRRGMTLVELVLAISLLGMIVVGAHGLVDVLATSSNRMNRRSRTAETAGAGHRLLHDLLGRVYSVADSSENFDGNAAALRFLSRCETPHGWIEVCRGIVRLRATDTARVVEIRLPHGARVDAMRVGAGARFIFLENAAGARRWIPDWGSSIDHPAAVGIVVDADTTFLAVGAFR